MKGYPLVTKKQVRNNENLKQIQKAYKKQHRHIKGRSPKARLSKLVVLRSENNFYDLSNKQVIQKAPESLTIEALLLEIREKGINGLSGSGFPTDKKMRAVLEAKGREKVLIINGVACDPGLLHDDWLVKNKLEQIEQAVTLINQCMGFSKVLLATREKVESKSCEVCLVPNKYPMGAEKILIQYLLGKSFDQGEIPAEKGILVLNIQTIYAIYEAIFEGIVGNTKLITIADLSSGEAVLARVNIGDRVMDILDQTIGRQPRLVPYVGEGIMMGKKVEEEDEITLSTNFIGYGIATNYEEANKCKGCGACSRKCPMGIKVGRIIRAMEKENHGEIKEYQPETCIQCGACTYFCKVGKNTMGLVEEAKAFC